MTSPIKKAGVLAATLLVAGSTASVVQAATYKGFRLGTYKGTTSQGDKLVLKLAKVSECGHKSGLCLLDMTQGYVTLTCPPPNSNNNYIAPGPLPIPASGKTHTVSHVSDGSLIEESIQIKHNGTITGTYKISKVPDSIDPETLTGYCSASVTYTLHHG
jgi:hypothetical protein